MSAPTTTTLAPSRRGAWLINIAKHLATKISSHPALSEIENVQFAGRCGSLLVALSAEDDKEQLTQARVYAIARHCGIDSYTLRLFLDSLKQFGCIDFDQNLTTVEVLAFTRHRVLETTTRIFDGAINSAVEKSLPEFLEFCLLRPRLSAECKTFLCKKLSESDADNVVRICEDLELLNFITMTDRSERLYFNGYQFGDKAKDLASALKSLPTTKRQELDELLGLVSSQPAILAEGIKISPEVINIAIGFGLVEESEVSSTVGMAKFLTLPRFAAPFVGDDQGVMELDVFHHAKELLAALKFGELKSHAGRGKLFSPLALVNALLTREQIGPATAIGQDYGNVEASGVIRTIAASNHSGDQRYMQLRRKEPALLLRKVLESSSEQIVTIPKLDNMAFPARYQGPEVHRQTSLKKIDPTTLGQFMTRLRS